MIDNNVALPPAVEPERVRVKKKKNPVMNLLKRDKAIIESK